MTEEKNAFEPITSQQEFDEMIKARLARERARERERLEKESGVEDLKAQLAAKDAELKEQLASKNEELAQIQRERYRENVRRELVANLEYKGITDEGRQQRILKHVDFDAIEPGHDGRPSPISVDEQLASIHQDMPELLPEKFMVGAGSGGSKRPVLKTEEPLTREQVEKMSESEINSNWQRVKRFMAGERG
jgi:hypothetical protein